MWLSQMLSAANNDEFTLFVHLWHFFRMLKLSNDHDKIDHHQ